MNKRNLLIATRLFFGTLVLIALLVQVNHLAEHNSFNAANFLSYFTNLSNMFAASVFMISAAYLATHRKPSARDDVIRGASVLYMAVTGTIYMTLLSGEDLGLLLPWVNIVLHYLMPLVVVVDWLYQPQRTKLRFKQTLLWLIFPAIYLVYSLIRGASLNWYPYPFLNPDKAGGYAGVAVYCVIILVVFVVLGWLLMKLGSKLKRHIN